MTDRSASMSELAAAGKREGLLAGVSDAQLAYSFFRFSMGVVIFFHGAMRMITGVDAWVAKESQIFVGDPLLPMWFVVAFLYVLPTIEVVLGTLTMVGLFTRWVLLAGAVLMLVLTFGNLTRQDWGTVGNELHYVLYYTIMIAGLKYNRFALDTRKAG
ncbi:MAG TPA: DoxX family protein [Micropepsaceae bacterium]|nr:DoxX family protein [Micropepsaceae bacterium]